jgi:hypothetical protein
MSGISSIHCTLHPSSSKKGPGWLCECANRVLGLGEASITPCMNASVAGNGWRERAMRRRVKVRRAGPNEPPSVFTSAAGSRHLLPGVVKRAVSRDGRGRHTAATNFAKNHSGLVVDVGVKPVVRSYGRVNARGVPIVPCVC